jgi:hypothetical protein
MYMTTGCSSKYLDLKGRKLQEDEELHKCIQNFFRIIQREETIWVTTRRILRRICQFVDWIHPAQERNSSILLVLETPEDG